MLHDIINVAMKTYATSRSAPSRLLLRLPRALHVLVQAGASAAGISVNEYCVRRLAAPGPGLTLDGPWLDVVTRAHGMFRTHLAGVMAHGSWVRGEATRDSDIDALVVVDSTVPLVRATYRRWDEDSLSWDGRRVDVHFVHLPDPDRPLSGLWYEAAVEGVIIHERAGAVSAQLLRARQAIAAGRVVRKVVQGQPYWTDAA